MPLLAVLALRKPQYRIRRFHSPGLLRSPTLRTAGFRLECALDDLQQHRCQVRSRQRGCHAQRVAAATGRPGPHLRLRQLQTGGPQAQCKKRSPQKRAGGRQAPTTEGLVPETNRCYVYHISIAALHAPSYLYCSFTPFRPGGLKSWPSKLPKTHGI